jgi:DNA-binding NtrC family response regulator
MTRKTILFVDDEPDILKGLRRMLYPLREKWDMLFAESGAEALETMQHNKISVLITDMRMPAMNGVQLLQTVQEHNPEIIRVMLTGQPDIETYHEVTTLSHYFLWKPTRFEDFEALFDRI